MKLTIDEIKNLIAFGNRAQMNGAEADTWFFLKQKLAAEGKRIQDDDAEPLPTPPLHSVKDGN